MAALLLRCVKQMMEIVVDMRSLHMDDLNRVFICHPAKWLHVNFGVVSMIDEVGLGSSLCWHLLRGNVDADAIFLTRS